MARAISSFVPTPSVAAASERAVADAEQSREPADLVDHLGAASLRGEVADQRHRLGGRLDVDARPAVCLTHGGVPA